MSTKYSTNGGSKYVEDDIALTDHAIHRYQQRTPHDCDVTPQQAWTRGEDVKHPAIAQSDGEARPPERVRVYRHRDEWGVVFLVDCDMSSISVGAPKVVVTVMSIRGFDHGPTRAYLYSHGAHDPAARDGGGR